MESADKKDKQGDDVTSVEGGVVSAPLHPPRTPLINNTHGTSGEKRQREREQGRKIARERSGKR